MKTVENKTVEIESFKSDYSKLIKDCCDVMPKDGWNAETMKKALRIDGAINKQVGQSEIDFEDADFEYIKEKVSTMAWAIKSQLIVDFVDYIKDLK